MKESVVDLPHGDVGGGGSRERRKTEEDESIGEGQEGSE